MAKKEEFPVSVSEQSQRAEPIMFISGSVLLSLALALAIFAAHTLKQPMTDAERLRRLWIQDLSELHEAELLPEAWNKISDLEVFAGTEQAGQWLQEIEPPIATVDEGLYSLEILVLSWTEDNILAAVIQHNLIEKKTNEMIAEFSRTYYLKGYREAMERYW